MKQATAIKTFRRSDNRKIVHAGYVIEGDDFYIDELARGRLVREVRALTGAPENKAHPMTAVSDLSSASPAAPVLPQTTASESDSGEAPKRKRGRPRKDAESS